MGDELVQLLPRVSVIVPSFNHKNYVEEAVNSVLSQVQDTFKLELLVVDDGSSDGSVDVLKALHSRAGESFQLILKGNEGLCQDSQQSNPRLSVRDLYCCPCFGRFVAS